MFINNNDFIHVTDGLTSLYKIIKRDLSKPNQTLYTVVSEAGNIYTYIFNSDENKVYAHSAKGFLIGWVCIKKHKTEVFENIDRWSYFVYENLLE